MVDQKAIPDSLKHFREAVEPVKASVSETRRAVREQALEAGKWVLATITALNAGGVLATLNYADRLSHPVLVAQLFLVGLISNLITAGGVAWVLAAMHDHASTLEQALDTMYLGDTAAMSTINIENGKAERLNSWFAIPVSFMIVSIIASIAAISIFTYGFTTTPTSNMTRCAIIQEHMLTLSNSRQDDAAMMQALGCRPQGNQMPVFPTYPKPTLAAPPKAIKPATSLLRPPSASSGQAPARR